MSDTQAEKTHTHEFKAEIKQLLDILIHSVYTSKEVFVRELVSNAADALEKVRFAQVAGQDIHSPDIPLEIRIETKKDDKLLVISDTGVGMSDDEVQTNIGTIAHSGATAFLERLKSDSDNERADDLNLIGRFGVGFYSVFMVAEKVVLTSRAADVEGQTVVWESDGAGTYTVDTLEEETPRGTKIEVHLKADDENFADETEIKSVIQRYSNFVPFPILVNDKQVNQTTALWREPASQVKDDQYNEFYKLISHDYQDPFLRLHHSIDAPIQFSALLFIPQSNPEAMGFGEGEVSLQLYVQRVLIDGDNKACLPKYLRFVKGVVESEDLPLNVSRETLQQNRMVSKIRDHLTRKLLDQLLDLAEKEPQEYHKFWTTFNRIFKEGYQDFTNREKYQELLRFNSTRHSSDDELVSLAEYVSGMPEQQTGIYYLSGASREALDRDPRLELFRKNQVEVLYLYELADEFVLSTVGEYKEKKLISADQVKPEDLKSVSGESETEASDESSESDKEDSPPDIHKVIDRFKEILGDRVTDVRTSERLVDSPACLVGDDDQLSGHMEKMMRIMNKSADLPKRVLELNPRHSLIENLNRLVSGSEKEDFVRAACEQLFEGCLLLDGYLSDPHQLVERMNHLLDEASALQTEKEKDEGES